MPTRTIIIEFAKFACFIGEPEDEREPDAWMWAMSSDDARQAFAKAKNIEPERVSVIP